MGKIAIHSRGLQGVAHTVDVGGNSATIDPLGGPQLTITADRGPVACAPEGIFFTANPTGFLVDRPATGTFYEPMRHELDFRWEITGTGDRRLFTACVNYPDEWRNWHVSTGHVMSRVFLPGDWTVTCTARHKRTGQLAKASTSFTVADPDTFYPASRTAIVHGGGSMAGAPAHDAGAEFTNMNEAATWARGKSGPCQVFVRSDFDRTSGRVGLTSSDQSLLYRVWDVDGGTPQWRYGSPDAAASNANMVDMTSSYDKQLTIWGIDLVGNWDPDTETAGGNGNMGVGILNRSTAGGRVTTLGCTLSGLQNAVSMFTTGGMGILESTALVNWQNFGVYGEEAVADCTFAMTDVLMVQSSDAIMGADKENPPLYGNYHSGIRLASMTRLAMAGIDTYSGNGWPTIGSDTPPYRDIQPCLRLWTGTPNGAQAGFYGHLERIVCEGGTNSLNIGPAFAGEITTVLNCTVDQVFLVGDYCSFGLARIAHSGVTVSNVLATVPKHDCLQIGMYEMFTVRPYSVAEGRIDGVPEVVDEPVRISGVSLYSVRDSSDDGGRSVGVANLGGDFTDVTLDGGIRHLPNRTGKSEAAPYVVSPISRWFTPRNTGPQRSVALGKETVYATNGAELATLEPDTGSPAIGAGLGTLPPVTDFWGRPRKATPDAGGIET